MIPFSVLDLSPIVEGGDAAASFRNTLDLARHAERLGFHRYWLAEHHGMPGIASAATSVVIGHVAAGTSTIRVGAGGIMLPNHAPLLIAEQFGTLESLFPGRIDLGLGRAPGSDQLTAQALRRDPTAADRFPQDVVELMAYFRGAAASGGRVRAVPGEGLSVPIWILGSSLGGAQLAAALGLPFAFASHFAPAQMMKAIALYRQHFRPSEQLAEPYVMLGFNVFAADTEAEAQLLATSLHQAYINIRLGRPAKLPPPRRDFRQTLGPAENAMLEGVLAASAIGTVETVADRIARFVAHTRADELIIACQMFDHAARVHSYELATEARRRLRTAA
jgi:luciferase family oxidoreductase group 1